ncbi:MAG: FAD-dependent oxidoreductase [Chloroflexota bacterium]
MALHRVLIIGGGFGGLHAARALGKDPRVRVTLVDRRNFHTFQPLLYQVATGAISPGDIAQPLRSILRKQTNTTVLLGEAIGIDPERREVTLSDGGPVPYDTLIVATGARHSYFGNDQWAPNAPGLKSIDDALEIRRRILIAFEAAEREQNLELRREWMTFVVIGGGPTGVELAGALGEIATPSSATSARSTRRTPGSSLVEARRASLHPYPADRSKSAKKQLEQLGVEVRVLSHARHRRGLAQGDRPARRRRGGDPPAPRSGPRACRRPRSCGAWPRPRAPRPIAPAGSSWARTSPVPGHPEIFALGDAAVQPWKDSRPSPASRRAPSDGHVGREGLLLARLDGENPGVLLPGQGRRGGHRPTARRLYPMAGTAGPPGRTARLDDGIPHLLPDRVRQSDRYCSCAGRGLLHERARDAADHGQPCCRRSRCLPPHLDRTRRKRHGCGRWRHHRGGRRDRRGRRCRACLRVEAAHQPKAQVRRRAPGVAAARRASPSGRRRATRSLVTAGRQ